MRRNSSAKRSCPAADAVRIEFQELVSDRQVLGSEIEKVDVPHGSAGDRRQRDLTAVQLKPATRGRTADFHGRHWTATSVHPRASALAPVDDREQPKDDTKSPPLIAG